MTESISQAEQHWHCKHLFIPSGTESTPSNKGFYFPTKAEGYINVTHILVASQHVILTCCREIDNSQTRTRQTATKIPAAQLLTNTTKSGILDPLKSPYCTDNIHGPTWQGTPPVVKSKGSSVWFFTDMEWPLTWTHLWFCFIQLLVN